MILNGGIIDMRHHFRLWGTLAGLSLLLLSLGGCLAGMPLAGVGHDSGVLPAYGLVTPREVASVILALEDNPNFVLLDIRTPAEVESGHISGAQNLDFYSPTFEQDLKKLDRDKIYLIYCRSGNRTGQARALMQELGFSKVYDLDGGINAWNNLSYPICLGPLDAEHDCSGQYPAL